MVEPAMQHKTTQSTNGRAANQAQTQTRLPHLGVAKLIPHKSLPRHKARCDPLFRSTLLCALLTRCLHALNGLAIAGWFAASSTAAARRLAWSMLVIALGLA